MNASDTPTNVSEPSLFDTSLAFYTSSRRFFTALFTLMALTLPLSLTYSILPFYALHMVLVVYSFCFMLYYHVQLLRTKDHEQQLRSVVLDAHSAPSAHNPKDLIASYPFFG